MAYVPFRDRITCTVPEACEATGIGKTKLYEEIAAGRIATSAVGRRRLVLVRSLLALVEGAAGASVQEAA